MNRVLLHTAADRSGFGVSRGNYTRALHGDGRTPLHELAQKGDQEAVKDLLAKEGTGQVDARTLWDFTPLHEAAAEGHLEVVRILLESGADANAVSRDGNTPIRKAAEFGHQEVLQLLLDFAELDPDSPLPWAGTPLLAAVGKGHLKVVQALLKAGADPNRSGCAGNTPLKIACAVGNEEIALALLNAGADPNGSGAAQDRLTPLHTACLYANPGCVLALIQWDGDETAADSLGRTPAALLMCGGEEGGESGGSASPVPVQTAHSLARHFLQTAPQIRRDARWHRRGYLIILRALAANERAIPRGPSPGEPASKHHNSLSGTLEVGGIVIGGGGGGGGGGLNREELEILEEIGAPGGGEGGGGWQHRPPGGGGVTPTLTQGADTENCQGSSVSTKCKCHDLTLLRPAQALLRDRAGEQEGWLAEPLPLLVMRLVGLEEEEVFRYILLFL